MISNPKKNDYRFSMTIDYFVDFAVEVWIKPLHYLDLNTNKDQPRLTAPELKCTLRSQVMKRLHSMIFGTTRWQMT